MASIWLRLYTEILNDPKVQRLPGDVFKTWVNLLCIAKEADHDGRLPSVDDVAFKLRLSTEALLPVLNNLLAADLIREEGGAYLIHGWDRRQYASDSDPTALDRKRRQRALQKSQRDVTPPALPAPVEGAPSQPKAVKHKHGAFGHVLLTDAQLADLKSKFNGQTERLIKELDEGIELKGYRYKNHALALQKWAKTAGIEPHGSRPDADKRRTSDPLFGGRR